MRGKSWQRGKLFIYGIGADYTDGPVHLIEDHGYRSICGLLWTAYDATRAPFSRRDVMRLNAGISTSCQSCRRVYLARTKKYRGFIHAIGVLEENGELHDRLRKLIPAIYDETVRR